MTASNEKPGYPIGSVDNALRLLRIVSMRERVRIAEAAAELDVSPSTAHRLMQMLVYHDLVRQEPETRAYVAGPELISLGLNVMRKLDVPAVARPFMDDLVAEFSETVHLFVLQTGGVVLCLDSVESPHALRVGSRVGVSLSAFASSSGRALLSTMPIEDVKALYPTGRLPRVQPGTVKRTSELLERIEEVRQLGYAVQRDESELGVSAVSAPVRLGQDVATFALTVALPTFRVQEELLATLGRAVSRDAQLMASKIRL